MAFPTASEPLLGDLVSFPTVSSASNLDLAYYTREYLASHGVDATLVPDRDGTKASLFATIGPNVEGGVILSGHTDVVPAEGQDWTSDPFRLRREGSRLYGRGTTDMKGFLAVALALVPEMKAAGLARPIHLAFSYDEEVGCLGAPPLIRAMKAAIAPPSAVIVGEPTQMGVVSAHKGVVKVTSCVRGKPVHSSVCHTGVSAVTYAARLAVWLDERMNRADRVVDERFDPPFTTLHSGIISGGTALNITAAEATLVSDIRALPGEGSTPHIEALRAEVERLSAEMRRVDPACGIEIEIGIEVPPCREETSGAAEALARRLTGDNASRVVAYGTEAGQFQDEGLSTIVCGPGNMDQGHVADEFIDVSQLRAAEDFGRRLIDHLKH
jgi:acetylornithine deacetylase